MQTHRAEQGFPRPVLEGSRRAGFSALPVRQQLLSGRAETPAQLEPSRTGLVHPGVEFWLKGVNDAAQWKWEEETGGVVLSGTLKIKMADIKVKRIRSDSSF